MNEQDRLAFAVQGFSIHEGKIKTVMLKVLHSLLNILANYRVTDLVARIDTQARGRTLI